MSTSQIPYGDFADVPDGVLSSFRAAGFPQPVPGVVYRGGRLGRGMPLGALGTGYLELTGDGRLGDTTVFNHYPSMYTGEQPPRFERPLLALATEGAVRVLAAPGDASREALADACYANDVAYWGHYPFAEMAFSLDLPLGVSLRAWTPFTPGDAASSNVPAALFELTLANEGEEAREVRVGLAFPGYPVEPGARYERSLLGDGVAMTTPRHGTAFGHALRALGADTVETGGVLGDEASPWSLLAGGLPSPSPEDPGATVAARVRLEPGERRVVTFVLAWYYPSFQMGGFAFPYQHMYRRRFASAAEVAAHVASARDDLRERTLAWQRVLYERDDLPAWMRDGLVNALYCLAKNSWWNVADGADDTWGPAGLFTMNETFRDCPVTETVPCRFFGHFPLLLLFPELEETTLRALAGYQLKTGEIPFALTFGSGLFDPRYHCVHPLTSGMFVQLLHRHYLCSGDRELVCELLPAVKDAVRFLQWLDDDGDGLVNEHPHALPGTLWPANNYHDAFPWYGTSVYAAGTWLATLRSAAALARLAGDGGYAEACDRWGATGASQLDAQLWRDERYLVYSDPRNDRELDASLLNQLMGEWCTRVLGLPSVIPDERAEQALETVLRENVARGGVAPIDTVGPDGRPVVLPVGDGSLEHQQASSCMVSEAICFAMTLMWRGRVAEGMQIAERVWEAHAIAHRTPFDQYYLIDPDDGAPVWGNDYYSNMITWAIPMALAGTDLAGYAGGSLVTACVAAGRGEDAAAGGGAQPPSAAALA